MWRLSTRRSLITPLLFTVCAFALSACSLVACTLAGEPVPAGPIESGPMPGEIITSDAPASLPRAAQGELIYLESCAACHGPTGSGQSELAEQLAQQGASLPDFTDPSFVRARSPQAWYRVITDGNIQALMPPWGGSLSDSQRWDVAYYLYTFTTPQAVIERGQMLYDELLAADYGPRGELIGLDSPAALAELSQQNIYTQFVAEKAADLPEADRWAIAAAIQAFGYDPALVALALDAPDLSPAEEAAPAEAEAEDAPAPPADAPEIVEADASAGVVQGQVSAATPGVSLPDGLEVQLRGIAVGPDNQVFEFLARTAAAGPDGSFRFEDVPFDMPRSAYMVEATYDGVTFTNGRVVDPASPALDLPLALYASTTDPAVVRVDSMHLILRAHPDALLVTQLYVFSNSSDRIVVTEQPVSGGRRGSVAVSLPSDAYGLSFEEGQVGGRFIPAGDRIYDTDNLLPGERTQAIIFNYFLPVDGAREVSIPILYQTRQVTVLAQDGQRIRSDQLSEAGIEVIDQTAYTKYLGTDLAPGGTLTFRLQAAGAASSALPVILIALAGVLLVGGGAYWLAQRRGLLPEPVAAGLSPRDEALIREIAALDEAYEAGRVNRFEYEARRADLKAAWGSQGDLPGASARPPATTQAGNADTGDE